MNSKDAARVKTLEAELVRIRNEIHSITEPYERQQAEGLVGLCYRTRNNYSCPEKPSYYWWLYVKVTGVNEHGSLRCLIFEVDRDGDVSVRKDDYRHPNSLSSYESIKPVEFAKQYARMLKHIEKLAD